MPEREHLRITFPHVVGYRVELPDEQLIFDPAVPRFEVGPNTVPRTTEVEGIVGAVEVIGDDLEAVRLRRVAYELAKRLLLFRFTAADDAPRPWLFPQLVQICTTWLHDYVDFAPGYASGHLLGSAERLAEAVEQVDHAVSISVGERRERLRPILRAFEPVGSTAEVSFVTRKAAEKTDRSEVSHVVFDGKDGNTWEQILALECDRAGNRVAAYVKNDHLGFTIPYVHQGRTHAYLPDFLLRLERAEGEAFDRTLIVEVSGGQKSPGPTKAKASTARNQWCVAVNNHGGFGRWGYVEITSMINVRERLAEAIQALYEDQPIIGDPELLDYAETDAVVARAAS